MGRFTLHVFICLLSSDLCFLREDIQEVEMALHTLGFWEIAIDATQILRLTGGYYWLINKQKKALNWWGRAIKKGEALGARPDLARTFFEIGKSLLEPDSKYKELNGITADEYLEKARTLFEEMDLQWDLDELDKLMSARQ